MKISLILIMTTFFAFLNASQAGGTLKKTTICTGMGDQSDRVVTKVSDRSHCQYWGGISPCEAELSASVNGDDSIAVELLETSSFLDLSQGVILETAYIQKMSFQGSEEAPPFQMLMACKTEDNLVIQ